MAHCKVEVNAVAKGMLPMIQSMSWIRDGNFSSLFSIN